MRPDALDWHGIGRRRFIATLARLAAGTAWVPGRRAVASGALLPLAACDGATPPRARGAAAGSGTAPLVLGATHAATARAVAQAVVPAQPGFPSVDEAQVVARLDEELWFADASIQDDLTSALLAIEWLPLAYGRLSRFSRSSLDARRELLVTMMRSRNETVRAVATNLRLLCAFFYFGHRSTWAAIGYDGPFQKLPPLASTQRQRYAETLANSAS